MPRRKRSTRRAVSDPEPPAEYAHLCPRAPEHGPLTYFEQAEAFACMQCDKWDKQRCPFPDCPDCKKLKTPPSKFLS